jgi:hypothetical protein
MLDDGETNQLLREVRDLLVEQSQIAKEIRAGSQERIANITKKTEETTGKLVLAIDRNLVVLIIWTAIVAAVSAATIIHNR